MSTALDELTSQDLGFDFDSEPACVWHGRPEEPMFFYRGDSEEGKRAGECSADGVSWLHISSCCGSRTFYCQGHAERWKKLSRMSTPEVLHGRGNWTGCGRARFIDEDTWVKI